MTLTTGPTVTGNSVMATTTADDLVDGGDL